MSCLSSSIFSFEYLIPAGARNKDVIVNINVIIKPNKIKGLIILTLLIPEERSIIDS